MNGKPRVAIVLLNYNGFDLTVDCLESLKRVTYAPFRSIVIDNGSKVNEGARLKERYGDTIDVIRHEDAKGFCAGNNVGTRMAIAEGYDYVLLLNNDTTVEPDFLTRLIDFMESNETIGLAGPKILRDPDRARLDSIGGDVNLWLGRSVNYKQPYAEPRIDLRFVSGCAFMMKRAAVEQVGFLDEDFYSYWEETDYCLRVRRKGWRIGCEPRAVIYHKGEQTNRHLSNRYIYYMVRNGLLCMARNGRWYQWPSFLLFFGLGSVAKYAGYLLLKRPGDLQVLFRAMGDFLGRRLGRREFEPVAA